MQGIFGWEAYSRIAQIIAPTLVIHGETDRLIPAANAKLIAERIPGAKLVLIPHASHIFEPTSLLQLTRRFWNSLALNVMARE